MTSFLTKSFSGHWLNQQQSPDGKESHKRPEPNFISQLSISFQPYRSVGTNGYLAVLYVALCEPLYLLGHGVGRVLARTEAAALYERVDLAFNEVAPAVHLCLYHRRIARYSCYAYSVRRAEVAQAVGYKLALIHLDTSYHMRAVAINYVGAVVYAEVGKVAQRAAVFLKILFLAVWQMTVLLAFGSAVERHYHHVGIGPQAVKYALHRPQFLVLQRVRVVAERTHAVSYAVARFYGGVCPAPQSGILYANIP